MGCNYGFPNYLVRAYSTSTYSGLSTSFYEATMAAQSTFTGRLTKTSYQNIPIYAALGLTSSQFMIIAVFTVLIVVGFGLLLLRQVGGLDRFEKPVSACKACSTELMPNDRFCGKCGAKIHDSG
jgi:rRNA maturation endonuclease Nob1